MTEQLSIDLARDLGHSAAKASADHADRVSPEWTDRALELVRQYAAARSPAPFLAEDVRSFAAARGLDDPPDPRAWGHVMQRARREGVIEAAGYAPAASSNGSPKVHWRMA